MNGLYKCAMCVFLLTSFSPAPGLCFDDNLFLDEELSRYEILESVGEFRARCTCRCGEDGPLAPIGPDHMNCDSYDGIECVNSDGQEDELMDCKQRIVLQQTSSRS